MSRRKAHVPSLADTLAKGFAELKADNEQTPPLEEVEAVLEVQEEVQEESFSKPDYRGATQHVAQESSFVVPAKKVETPPQEKEELPEPEKVEIRDRPTTSLGDDFDVEW